ncbi:hypothetical protein, partial [Azospirillum melinis]
MSKFNKKNWHFRNTEGIRSFQPALRRAPVRPFGQWTLWRNCNSSLFAQSLTCGVLNLGHRNTPAVLEMICSLG